MKVLVTRQQLHRGVSRFAQQISDQYRGQPLMMIGILQDSIILMADLIRLMEIPSQIRIVQPAVDHWGPARPTELRLERRAAEAIRDHHVLIVDDVFATGVTLFEMICQVDDLRPLSVKSAVLLCKQGQKKTVAGPDYVVFEVPDGIIVGYGLDYQGQYRHLPHIAMLEPHELSAQPGQVMPSIRRRTSVLTNTSEPSLKAAVRPTREFPFPPSAA